MKKILQMAAPLIVPLGLPAAAIYCLNKLETLSSGLIRIIDFLPYLLLGIAAILGWRFNKSKVFFIAIVLVLAEIFAFVVPGTPEEGSTFISPVLTAASVLVPINIILFSILKERGVFTVWGLLNAGIIVIQMEILSYLMVVKQGVLVSISKWSILPWNTNDLIHIPQLSVLILTAALLFAILRFISTRACLDAANIGVLLSVSLAFIFRENKMTSPAFLSVSGIILIVSLIQDSYSMAFLDELTGLPSRRSLRYELMKLSGKYTIAMLDIDFFKKFNDTYGHDVGDQVLKMVAGCLKNVSGGGKSFRYGGEEFTVVFPNKVLKEALPHLEELREAVSKKGFVYRSNGKPQGKQKNGKGKTETGKQLFVTISIGAAERNDKYRLPDEVIKAADGALYRAKKKGRNCVSK